MIHKIIFLGTTQTAQFCLKQLHTHPNIEVKAVITKDAQTLRRNTKKNSRSIVSEYAQKHSIPILTPQNLKDSVFLSKLKAYQARWAVTLAYGKILPKEFLDLFPNQSFNFHASLLPKWRGAAPIQRAILADDKELGMSLQIMKLKLDTGDIVSTRSFQLKDTMDALDVFQKMEFLIKELIQNLIQYMEAPYPLIKQKESIASYAHKIRKIESAIAWDKPGRFIFNQIRALVLGPAAYTTYKNKRIKFLSAKLSDIKADSSHLPGQIIAITKNYFTVATTDIAINILKLQVESKKAMPSSEYLKGHCFHIGDQFE